MVTAESEDWDLVEISYWGDGSDLVEWAASFGADVVVLAPADLRAEVAARLGAVAAGP